MRRSSRWAAIGLISATMAAAAVTALSPYAALATYSGKDGRIAYGAFVGAANADIFTVKPDGTERLQLTDARGFDACPAVGRRGKVIAFCSDRSGALEIRLMKQDGEQQRQLTSVGGVATFPAISPDGEKVAFCGSPPGAPPRTEDIWVVNIDGTVRYQLTDTPGTQDCYLVPQTGRGRRP